MATKTTEAAPEVRFELAFDPYRDGGTGYTADAQNGWLVTARAAIRREVGRVAGLPRCVEAEWSELAAAELRRITPSNDELLALAAQSPPPAAWLDEDEEKPFTPSP